MFFVPILYKKKEKKKKSIKSFLHFVERKKISTNIPIGINVDYNIFIFVMFVRV